MLWKEVKKWAKEHGYQSVKTDGQYHWHKADDPSINGIEKSVSKLAKRIYNEITNNAWKKHQEDYIA